MKIEDIEYKVINHDLTPSTTPSSCHSESQRSPSTESTGQLSSSNRKDEYEKGGSMIKHNTSTVFGGCCALSSMGNDSLDITKDVETEFPKYPYNTAELIKKLAQAENEGKNMIYIACIKRRQELDRAKKEAEEEAELYRKQFEIEFSKLEVLYFEEIERFSYEINRRTEQDIKREDKRYHRARQDAMFYVLDRTCAVELRLSDAAVKRLQRIAMTRSLSSSRGMHHNLREIQREIQRQNDRDPQLEVYGLCPKHRSLIHYNPNSTSTSSRQISSTQDESNSY